MINKIKLFSCGVHIGHIEIQVIGGAGQVLYYDETGNPFEIPAFDEFKIFTGRYAKGGVPIYDGDRVIVTTQSGEIEFDVCFDNYLGQFVFRNGRDTFKLFSFNKDNVEVINE